MYCLITLLLTWFQSGSLSRLFYWYWTLILLIFYYFYILITDLKKESLDSCYLIECFRWKSLLFLLIEIRRPALFSRDYLLSKTYNMLIFMVLLMLSQQTHGKTSIFLHGSTDSVILARNTVSINACAILINIYWFL